MSEPRSNRTHRHFSDDFKLSVLKDFYESGKSYYFINKKYNLSRGSLQSWQKKYPLSELSVSLSPETQERLLSMAKKTSENPIPGSLEARIAELEAENNLLKSKVKGLHNALEYSELRVEGLSRAIKIYNEQEGVDVLKKAGTRQQ